MKNDAPRPRGRPRKFDRDEVLEKAVDTFWSKGYDSTSLDDLTESMGINRPSLYGSFGNKHDLFMASIDYYAETIGQKPLDALQDEAEIRNAIAAFVDTTIRCVTASRRPRGCLIMNVASERSVIDRAVHKRISELYNEKIEVVSGRIAAAQKDGKVSRELDSKTYAQMIVSIMQIIASRARVGASRKELAHLATSFLDIMFPPKRN